MLARHEHGDFIGIDGARSWSGTTKRRLKQGRVQDLMKGGARPKGSTKFTLFETVTSLVPPTSRGAAHRWPPLVLAL